MFVSVAEQKLLFRQGSEVNNFWYDVQDLYPLQKEKKIKKQRKGLGPDHPVVLDQSFNSEPPTRDNLGIINFFSCMLWPFLELSHQDGPNGESQHVFV